VRTQPFALLCGYHVAQLRSGDRRLVGEICAAHGHASVDESPLQRRVRRLEREIERRRLLETQVAEREMELTDFLENAVVGLHKVDANGIISWANRAELDMLGYAPDEYIGHRASEFLVA